MTPSSTGRQAKPGNDDVPHEHPHPLDAFVADPSGMTPLCDEPMFASIVESTVADESPRLFAIVQEYGERVDCRIAAWAWPSPTTPRSPPSDAGCG